MLLMGSVVTSAVPKVPIKAVLQHGEDRGRAIRGHDLRLFHDGRMRRGVGICSLHGCVPRVAEPG